MIDIQARWNIIKNMRKSEFTIQQLREEIMASERRQREDENGILDIKIPYDDIDSIINDDTIQVIRVW